MKGTHAFITEIPRTNPNEDYVTGTNQKTHENLETEVGESSCWVCGSFVKRNVMEARFLFIK